MILSANCWRSARRAARGWSKGGRRRGGAPLTRSLSRDANAGGEGSDPRDSTMARIGFIGLGNMGVPMAGNLVKQGHQVKGFDIVAANIDKAVARGVAKAASVADAVKDAEVVVTMLPAGRDTLAVWSSGMLEAAAAGTLIVDSSTIDVASARKAHQLAA